MYIPNDDTQNYPFSMDTQLNEQTNQNQIKVPKVVQQKN